LEPDPDASFGARAAGGVGEALTDPLSWIGPGGLALKAAGAVTGAVGSEAAGSAADALGLPELPARVLGGALAGRATGAVAGAPAAKQGTRALLNSQELHDESRTAYQQLENAPLRVRPDGMLNLHNAVNKALDQDAFDPMTAPLTYHFVDRLIDQRPQQHPAKLRDIVNIHEKLGQISPQRDAKDAAAAGLARSEIRNWLEQNIPQTQPQLRNALGNWSAHKKSEELGTVEDVARHRAGVSGTGSNVQNTMRQEIRKILDNPRRARGYSPAQLAQMEKVVEGTVAENVARWAGRFAPTGLHSTMGLAFISHIMNSSLALVGAGAAYGAKKIGDVFTRQEIEKLATMVLEGAPANRAQAARNAAQRASSLVASRAQAVRSAAPPIEQTPYDVLDNPSGIDFDQTPAR
jgi:hypothetical protein